MITLLITNPGNSDFVKLVKLLDADLAIRDGEEHAFYARFNKSTNIRVVVIAYENGKASGCGALKAYSGDTMEIKRMYVLPESRNKGIASEILSELENRARELSFLKCILETGKMQLEAIGLYLKNGYKVVPNYGQYAGMENSVCFEKGIS